MKPPASTPSSASSGSRTRNILNAGRLIAGALMFAVVMYALLPLVAVPQLPAEGATSLPPTACYAILVVAALCALLSRPLAQLVLRRRPGEAQSETVALNRYLLSIILTFAVLEFAAILALVAAVQLRAPFVSLAGGIVALVLMVRSWPREGELNRVLSRD
jgi:hypothetical protein